MSHLSVVFLNVLMVTATAQQPPSHLVTSQSDEALNTFNIAMEFY